MNETENEFRSVQSIQWIDDYVRIIDQTCLPEHETYLDIHDAESIREAICSLRIRGAPAIGIAAAYGLYLGIKESPEKHFPEFKKELNRICDYLASARPTANNLRWTLDRMKYTANALSNKSIASIKEELLELARAIHEEDKRICADIGKTGEKFIPDPAQILTHCNTGSLATGQYGTAMSVISHAHWNGKTIHVWVDETRPLLQGSRLTSWELQKTGIDHHIITDSMAGWVMKNKGVDLVIVGTDRVARNGDTANKIGTYSLAILARHHGIPFYVAAPLSAFDTNLASGEEIPIEERDGDELRKIGQKLIAPAGSRVYNPAFDVTPHEMITAFITEKGVITPDFSEKIPSLAG